MIRHNLFTGNRTAQVQGWFDIGTERHWPKALQTGKVEKIKAKDDLAAGFQARKDGVPSGLSLEDLKITVRGNFYAIEPGQPFFIWGPDWKRRAVFTDIPTLTQMLGFEDQRQALLPPLPVDLASRDFRLPHDHPARAAGAYPQGQVPDCVLGVR